MARVRCALALLVATAAAFAPLSGAPGRRNLQPTVDPATPAAPPALAHAPRWLHRGAVARQMTTLPLEEGGMGPLMVGLLNPTSLDVIEERLGVNASPALVAFLRDARASPLSAMHHFANPEVSSTISYVLLGADQ